MARLTTTQRDRLPKSDYGFPERIHVGERGAKDTEGAYPIDTPQRARSGLARASHDESKRNYLHLARRIHRKFPKMRIKALEEKPKRRKR